MSFDLVLAAGCAAFTGTIWVGCAIIWALTPFEERTDA